MKNRNDREKKKKGREREKDARRAFVHMKSEREREREKDRHASSTRVISRPAMHAHRCLAITTRINTFDDYQSRRERETEEGKRIRTSVTNGMCNEPNSIRCSLRACVRAYGSRREIISLLLESVRIDSAVDFFLMHDGQFSLARSGVCPCLCIHLAWHCAHACWQRCDAERDRRMSDTYLEEKERMTTAPFVVHHVERISFLSGFFLSLSLSLSDARSPLSLPLADISSSGRARPMLTYREKSACTPSSYLLEGSRRSVMRRSTNA